MKLLLDTNALLTWLDEPANLTGDARIAIANPQNFVFVSPVSIVEIVIKESQGKLKASGPFDIDLTACRFRELPFSIAHAGAMRSLPPIHKDPFDRMLVAQSRVDQLTLVTRDLLLREYDIPILAA